MVSLSVGDVLGLAGILAACAGLGYLGYRIEPHWVAKDGSRFLTMAQELDRWSTPVGRRREVRVGIDRAAGLLDISLRSLVGLRAGRWRVSAKAPDPPRGRAVYFLDLVGGDALSRGRRAEPPPTKLALRLPAKSKVIPVLDAMAEAPPPPG